eukprot:372229-Pyramimonas_sp.AAC.1
MLAIASIRSVSGALPASPTSQANSAASRAHASAAALPAAISNSWSGTGKLGESLTWGKSTMPPPRTCLA